MNIPERSLEVARPRVAWRWAANAVTVCIFALGLLAAALAMAGRANSQLAAAIIVLAALVDGTDGALARRAGGPTRAGALLDVAADLTAFGLAPAALATANAAGASAVARAPGSVWLLVLALGVYLAAALWRLVRSARLALSKPAEFFVGLPMPTAGCLVAGLALNLPAVWVGAALLFISALAVSRRAYPSVPWMWQERRASLLAFIVVSALIVALSPAAGLLISSSLCAAYPWLRPLRA